MELSSSYDLSLVFDSLTRIDSSYFFFSKRYLFFSISSFNIELIMN
jgi:hypothetical protein